jgi:hypothetical protein
MLGFEASLPHFHTIVDLTLADNKVDHECLLNIIRELSIPPVYGRFYKGFLDDRIFQICCRNDYSKWKKESGGTPQGTVSLPILFLIYMEGFLHSVLPTANMHTINMAMFADDLTVWKTGGNIPYMAAEINDFISNTVDPWMTSHNMIISDATASSFPNTITTLNLVSYYTILNSHMDLIQTIHIYNFLVSTLTPA